MIDKKYITFKKEPFFEIANNLISDGSVVLDIGAGDGKFANYCNRQDFYLFDGNKESIEELRKVYKNVFEGKLPALPFEDNYFDLIHCSHVIEHLEPQIFYDTLVEVNRCLKKGGYLVVSAPLYWIGFYNDLSHVKPYNPKIFFNYLCNNQSRARTRSKISTEYTQEELIFRYREKSLLEDYFIPRKWLFKISIKISELLKKSGLKKIEKTGYTIVLKKSIL